MKNLEMMILINNLNNIKANLSTNNKNIRESNGKEKRDNNYYPISKRLNFDKVPNFNLAHHLK